MSIQAIETFIRDLTAAKGANDKKKILNRPLPPDEAMAVMQYVKAVLDPFKMYYIKKLPEFKQGELKPNALEVFHTNLQRFNERWCTGNEAIEECRLMVEGLGFPQHLLQRALNKSLDCGVGIDTINSTWPKNEEDDSDFIKVFKVALAKDYEPERCDNWRYMDVSIKYDGIRAIACVDPSDESVRMFSRNGLPIVAAENTYPELVKMVRKSWGGRAVALDMELVTIGDFEEASGKLRKKKAQAEAHAYIFDLIPLDKFETQKPHCTFPQEDRQRMLKDLFMAMMGELQYVHMTESWACKTPNEVAKTSQWVRSQIAPWSGKPHEGVIIKNPDSQYSFDRTYDWMKIKEVKTFDVILTGKKIEGKGKFKGTLGALEFAYEGVLGQCGGFTDADRRSFWAMSEEELRGKMMEVLAQEGTKYGSLRHPRYSRMRFDK